MARLTLKNVTVQYPIYNSRSFSLRNQIMRVSTGGRIESEAGQVSVVTALKDVSFDLRDGDADRYRPRPRRSGKLTAFDDYCPASAPMGPNWRFE